MKLDDLTPEQIEKAKACKTYEELLALAKDEGIELSEKQLEQISGGDKWGEVMEALGECPYCHSGKIAYQRMEGDTRVYMCLTCGKEFESD